MRHLLLLAGVVLLLPPAAHAQVTIDLRALEALPQAPPPPPKPAPRPVLRTVPAGPTATATLPVPPVPPSAPQTPAAEPATPNQAMASAKPAAPSVPAPPAAPANATPPAAPPPATLPTAAPAVASLAPIPPPVAPAPARPPAPPPVSATAGTTASPENAGLRLEFKSDQSDLSPAANGAIGDLVKTTTNGPTVTFNVVAYAAGAADDPSVARRMSLARGLSVRAALIADGVPSTRIYVRALGAAGGDGPPDRVDLTVLGTSGASAAGTAPGAPALAPKP